MTAPPIPPFVFSQAVRHFWFTLESQAAKKRERGTLDQGRRGDVTGGQHMNGFISAINSLLISAEVSPLSIHTKETRLPGFYRPTNKWDMVIVSHDELVAAIEIKSQVGSFSNNFNNRTEEAIGSASDIWTAYREGAFRTSPAPWIGYLLLLNDCLESQTPVRVSEPYFAAFPEFRNASYIRRYELFCRKLVLERQYSAACLLLSSQHKAAQPDNYEEPAADLSAGRFLTQLLRHAAAPL